MAPDEHGMDPALVLNAYAQGIFPMAENAHDPEIFWIRPEKRGIIPLEHFHIPRSLAKIIRQKRFDIRCDTDFPGIIKGCAEIRDNRPLTWINEPIRGVYEDLFKLGYCHTVEAWRDGRLAGGLYGLALGGAFFGESMFSRERDASKVCLAFLVKQLRNQGFILLDTQFITEHLKRFGAIEIPRRHYDELLKNALATHAHFLPAAEV